MRGCDTMLGCNKTITLVHHIETVDSDSYTATVMEGVGYTEETKLQQDGKAVVSADVVTVTIPQEITTAIPIKGDHVVLGRLDSPPENIAKIKNCGLPVYRVIAVNDYRGNILGHWELIGS